MPFGEAGLTRIMTKFLHNLQRSKKGQVAVVILLIVAFALIFYAATLNLGRIGQNKVVTQIGAAQGASALASAMASYGQSLFMQQLGGRQKKCQSSGLLGAILGFVLAVVLTIFLWEAAPATMQLAAQALLVIGTVLAATSLVLQITVIQPGITSAWNSLAADLLPLVDQFMENALRGALQSATSDPVQVPDLNDMDLDGSFGLDAVTSEAIDNISRFSLYYAQIFDGITVNFIPEAENFQVALQDFVYQLPPVGPNTTAGGLPATCGAAPACGPDQECVDVETAPVCVPAWGLWDPLPEYFVPGPIRPPPIDVIYPFTIPQDLTNPCFSDPANVPSVCNPCCLPLTTPDPRGPSFGQLRARPGCCECSTLPSVITIPDPTDPTGVATIDVFNPDFCTVDGCIDACGGPLQCPVNAASRACCDACGDITQECGTSATCQALSPYGFTEPTLGTFYAWVYNAYEENWENSFRSFREQLGRDDEHRLYFKDSSNPNWAPQFAPPWLGSRFYADDSTGFYIGLPVVPPAVGENRRGVFPFLWKITTWGYDLDDLTTPDPTDVDPIDDPFDQRCKWCDENRGVVCDPRLPYQMVQLNLPFDPTTLTIYPTYCVDTYIDNVSLIPSGGSLEYPAATCVDPDTYAGNAFWKRGADRFCSEGDIGGDSAWPYESQCPKYTDGGCFLDPNGNGVADCPAECDTNGNAIPALCQCGDPSATDPLLVRGDLFPEDVLDELIYGLTAFFDDANAFLARGRANIAIDFENWFNDWQAWIDPGPWANQADVLGDPAYPNPYPDCYPWDTDYDPSTPDVCQSEPGQLYYWLRNINLIHDELIEIKETSHAGVNCNRDPWCVPIAGCADVSAFEEVTFDYNANGINGDVEDIIACLTFNVDGYDYACNGGVPDATCLRATGDRQGNDFRYANCMLSCSAAACTNLPRSVLAPATYDPNAYVAANVLDEPDMSAMLLCVHSCGNPTCTALPANRSSDGTPYVYTATPPPAFDPALDCTGLQLNDANGWRTAVRDSLLMANPTCDIAPGGWLDLTGTSAIEAANQVIKMQLRRDFLEDLVNDMNQFIVTMNTARIKFYEFLTAPGPVADLIQARFDYDANPPDHFPFQAIYGWQDPIPPEIRLGAPGGESYWHIVKVEGRMPKRCDNACGVGGNPDPEWPKVRTYTKKMGLKRCYELVNTDGIVKFRVLRFDEAPNSTGSGLTFPNGQPLWKFRFFHPSPNRGDVDAATLGTTCDSIMITDPRVPVDTFKGAFFMNQRVGTGDTDPVLGNNWNCWNRTHFILANGGIGTEVCAQYYLKQGVRPGMTFSFIPCEAF